MTDLIRTGRAHPLAVDVVVAAVLSGGGMLDNAVGVWHAGATASGPAIMITVAAAYASVLGRRSWPIGAAAVTVTAAAAYMAVSTRYWWIAPAPMIALYHLATTSGDRRRLLTAGCLTAVVLVGIPAAVSWWHASWSHGTNLAVAAACGLAVAAGDATRSAEQSREQQARRRVTEERLRIARELHDSIGHHLALINAQAGMAEHVFGVQPATAREALGHIKQTSRAALDDLRGTVGLLRQPGDPTIPTEPTAGIAAIGDLITSLRGTGMQVEHEIDSGTRPLPRATELTAYRIVQESLTNVGKHAPGAAARVRLSYQPHTLHVIIDDTGDDQLPAAPNGTGHGITGMTERVTALGGTLDAGPLPGGGFRVHAALPL